MIEESSQREVNRVMNEMGKALASISGQFAKDYRSLVSAMQEIVNQGRNLS